MKRLTLRTTLTLVQTGIPALLLTALSFASYHVLALHLDLDATDDLGKMTGGLRGYLHFDAGTPVLVYDRNDAGEVAFINAATRYFQIYDANSGRLLTQSVSSIATETRSSSSTWGFPEGVQSSARLPCSP